MSAALVLRESAALYARGFARWVLLVAVAMVPADLVLLLLDRDRDSVLGDLVSYLVVTPLVSAAVAVAVVRGRPEDVRGAYRHALPRLPALVGATVATTVLVALGFVLLVVPGVIALGRFLPIVPVVALEDRAGFGVERAWSLGRRATAPLVALALAVVVVTAVLGVVVWAAVDDQAVAWMLVVLVDLCLTPFAAIVSAVAYLRLRAPAV